MRAIALSVSLMLALGSSNCEHGAPSSVHRVDPGRRAPSSSSAPSPPSAAIHPALDGKPPSYWNELSQKPRETAPLPERVFGKKVRYDGFIFENSACLCSTGTAVCDGMTIRGVDWAKIPWAKRSYSGGREARVTLRGILTPLGLNVTEPPERLPDLKETVMSGPLPCTPPPGGFRQRHSRVGSADYDRLIAYAEGQPDLSRLWNHYYPHITVEQSRIRPPRSQDHVFVFRFVSNADRHRAKLEELWGGPICVVQGGLDADVRDAIASRGMHLAVTEGREHGLLCRYMSGYFDGGTDELVLGATTWNRTMLESWLSEKLGGFRVRVRSELDAW